MLVKLVVATQMPNYEAIARFLILKWSKEFKKTAYFDFFMHFTGEATYMKKNTNHELRIKN